jgi:hypothetical protein
MKRMRFEAIIVDKGYVLVWQRFGARFGNKRFGMVPLVARAVC